MPILDFFKKFVSKKSVSADESKQTIEIKQDTVNFTNDQYMQMRYQEIENLTSLYDFESIEGIEAIPVPTPPINGNSVTGQVDYYLRIKASDHRRNNRMDLAIACLRKANELMPYSIIGWQAKDYLRLIRYLRADKQFSEARKVKAALEKQFPELLDDGVTLSKERLQKTILYAKQQLNTDLMEMSIHSPTCAECSKYQGRIFSISGHDSRYPKLPKEFLLYGGVHAGCRHIFYPYLDGSIPVSHQDPIAFSNRPFVDTRTEKEIQEYDEMLKLKQYELQKDEDREKYYMICEQLPEVAPKSFGGYRKMKNSNSLSFQKLKEAAKEIGLDL